MKKSIFQWIRAVVFATSLMFVSACSFSAFDVQTADITDISGELSYSVVSRQAFMGGSVLYNPENMAASQLAKGGVIAVRLGKTERTDIDSNQAVFTDNPDYERYGFIKISSINSEELSFTYTQYDTDGSSITQVPYTLSKGEELDLNNDGFSDLTYVSPATKRAGMKKALWLTFLSSQETLNTAMFAILPEQYSRCVYPAGLMGINPDGRFIVTKYDVGTTTRAAVQGIAFGDYVLDSETGEYQKVIGSSSYRNARSIDDGDLETVSDTGDVDFLFALEDFVGFQSPMEFLSELPDILTADYKETVLTDLEAIEVLNSMLKNKDLISVISLEKEITLDDEIQETLDSADTLTEYELVSLNRLFLDEVYAGEFSPVDIYGNSITDILPLASVTLDGTSDDTDEETVSGERAAVSYSDYASQKQAIEKEFKKYHIFEPIPKREKEDNEDSIFKHLSINMKMGIGGKYSISWSHVEGSLAGLVFLQAESSITFSKTIESSESNDTPKHLYFKKIPFSEKLVNADKTIAIGPIPFSVGLSGDIEVPFMLNGSVSLSTPLFMGVTGLYGAQTTVGADYGTRWKKWFKVWRKWVYRPSAYFDAYANGSLINKTAYYIGPSVPNSILPTNFVFSGTATISPTFKLTPKVGLCQNTVWLGLETSNILDLGITGSMSNMGKPLALEAYVDYKLKLKPRAGVTISIPVIKKTWSSTYDSDKLPSLSPVKRRIASWRIL